MIQCGCLLGPVVGGVWVYMRLVVTVEPGITMWLSIGPCSGWGLGIYETSGYSGTWDSV